MAKKRHYAGSYEGMDSRRKQEREDGSMLSEDRNACANLPQMVKYHTWPTNSDYENYGLDDTGRGIDKQEREDISKMKRHLQPGKY